MIVPDAFSRAPTQHDPSFSSPDEKDPYFPYVPENTGNITLPDGGTLQGFLLADKAVQGVRLVNHMALAHDSGICLQSDKDYDADSEIIDSQGRTKQRLIRQGRKSRNQEMQNTKLLRNSLQRNEMTDQTEQCIDHSLTVDQEQAEQTDSQTRDLNQASNISTNNSSPSESETSQSSFLEDEVKKGWNYLRSLILIMKKQRNYRDSILSFMGWSTILKPAFCQSFRKGQDEF